MPSSAEINSYLDWLQKHHAGSGFVMVPRGNNLEFPWVEEFAFVSADYTSEPVEQPRTGDRLFLVVRNYSLNDCVTNFECRSEKGKMLLGDPIDAPLRRSIVAPINPGYEPLPNEEEVPLTIEESLRVRTDFLHVKCNCSESESGTMRREHQRPLAYRFD